ncbi:MAG: hypothetical protein AAGU74_04935 [Bacillota bacterium]
MTKEAKQRLCGGTFFTLLLQARKPRKGVREHYMGESDGLSDPQTLIALIKVAVPDYSTPDASMMSTFKGNTSRYKSCQNNGGTYMPFSDKVIIQSFNNRIQSEYASALAAMSNFTQDFIDIGTSTKKDEWLVKALLDLLDKDDSIDTWQTIYTREDGSTTTKAAILSSSNICLQPFLLGIWHFILLCRTDNTVGQETYNDWCPASGGDRTYASTLGEAITRPISISYCAPQVQTAEAEIVDASISDDDGPEVQKEAGTNSGTTQQVVNNNPTFFNFNVTGNNNNFIDKVDTVIIKNGGRKDEF